MGDGRYEYISGEVSIDKKGQPQGLPLQEKNVGVPFVGTQNMLDMSPEQRSQA